MDFQKDIKMVRETFAGFKQFVLRGNVLDLAVGIVIGAGFSSVINAFVRDIIVPFISVLIKTSEFSNSSFTVNGSKFFYGDFISVLISFILVAIVVYFIIIAPTNILIARMRRAKPLDPTTKKCKECLSEIPKDAKRCAFCTQPVS